MEGARSKVLKFVDQILERWSLVIPRRLLIEAAAGAPRHIKAGVLKGGVDWAWAVSKVRGSYV